MYRRLLLPALVLLAACGDSGPSTEQFSGLWQLSTVNSQPIPATGTTTGTSVWVAAVLQIQQGTGTFDRCFENPSTSTQTNQSTYVVTKPLSGDKLAVQYSERRDTSADTASMQGANLILHYRETQVGGPALATDVLTFVPLAGDLPPACSLAPAP
jgi:hypothetical protein